MESAIEKVAQIAQETIDKENATNPIVKTALSIVEDFIKDNRVMCYGGTAINNLLPKEDRFYDPEKDIPDYDFFSDSPQIHAAKLADQLTNAGFRSVEVKPGVHLGTFKVFSDYIGVADISHLDKPIFEKLWKNSIEKEGIHYVPPNFLRMSIYLELSRPKGDVSRWKKVYSRLMLLNTHYAVECPAVDEKMNDVLLTSEIKEDIEKFLIKENIVLLGFNASILQQKPTDKWMLPLDVLVTPEKREETKKEFLDIFEPKLGFKLKVKDIPRYGELIPPHTDIDDPKSGNTVIRIYETEACHSYHKAPSGLMIASIPTLLQFFFAILYAPESFLEEQPEQRFLCTAQRLVEMANDNIPRRYKLLTPITCLGKQKSLVDMRVEKSKMYEELSKNKSSPEFLEYFFTYVPTSMDKTRRRKVREQLHKTFRNRQQHRY
jgi:hypothetical protein